MIISASYRTDIPGYYAAWFERRYRAGFCLVANPFDQRLTRVPLQAPDVQGYVFWTRNAAPCIPALHRLRLDGLPFVVHYTITDYPRALETHAANCDRAVMLCHELAELFGPAAVVWRYDPVVITSLTDLDRHRFRFEQLCRRLAGATDEVVVSFAHMYRKTVLNLKQAAKAHGFTYEDPTTPHKTAILLELSAIAAAHGLKLSVCAQRELLRKGLGDAACIDPERLGRVNGEPLKIVPRKAHRASCGCFESVDIGAYDTCATGCVYCYAVRSRSIAEQRRREHRPDDLLLWRPKALRQHSAAQLLALAEGKDDPEKDQLKLFDEW